MEIIEKNINELKEYENNPRKNNGAVDYVANSIKEFGFKVPIIIDSNGTIIAGHTRYKASKKLGLEKVPCLIADDLTDEQIKLFRIVDNKTSENSSWDQYKLILELEQLEVVNFNMDQFGFTKSDIQELSITDNGEIDLSDFEDENFQCKCPNCGFVFDEKE